MYFKELPEVFENFSLVILSKAPNFILFP